MTINNNPLLENSSAVECFIMCGWDFAMSLPRSFLKWLMATLNKACFEWINYLFI